MEEEIITIQRHCWKQYNIIVLVILLAGGLLYSLENGTGIVTFVSAIVTLIIGIYCLLYSLTERIIITSRSIIINAGLFIKDSKIYEYEQMLHVSKCNTFLNNSLVIETAGEYIEFRNITNIDDTFNAIIEQLKNTQINIKS